MTNKRYNDELKKKYDTVGKSCCQKILRDLTDAELLAENHMEDMGKFSEGFWDQMYRLPCGKKIIVESEIKDCKWWGYMWNHPWPFMYDTVDVPFRKNKNLASLFVVISSNLDFAFIMTKQSMTDSLKFSGGRAKWKRTIYEPNGAYYFSVSVESGYFVKKVKDKWKICKKVKEDWYCSAR
jgi:hypothetical protein